MHAGGVHDVINRAIVFENRPKGFGAGRPRNLAFPIDFAGHPYGDTENAGLENGGPKKYQRLENAGLKMQDQITKSTVSCHQQNKRNVILTGVR